MQVGVELGSGGCHIVSSAMVNHPSYPDVVECFREMPSNPVAVECLQGGHMVIIESRNVKNPSYPDVVECFRECHPILQSWNVSRAGTEGHHRRMMYCESGQEDLPAAIPLAVMEFFGSPTTSVGSLVYLDMCCVCVVRGFCLTASDRVRCKRFLPLQQVKGYLTQGGVFCETSESR